MYALRLLSIILREEVYLVLNLLTRNLLLSRSRGNYYRRYAIMLILVKIVSDIIFRLNFVAILSLITCHS